MNLIQVESMKRMILLVLCILLVTSAYGADTQKLYNKTVTSVVSLKVDTPRGGCIGSGFYALEPDIIVTCYHVVEGATNIIAKTNNGNIVSIDGIIDYSQEKDIALLKASSKNSTFLELQANMPKPGTPAYVLGSPKGLDFSFSNGMVSQIRRGKETLIQFTCPVSSGNSGGPLLSEDGKVLGIVSCQLTEGQNLNFAVPSASLYMLNKDNAVTKIQNSNYVNNSNYSEITSSDAYKKGMEHYELGIKYLDAHLYDSAEKELLLALNYYPENLYIYDYLSKCYFDSGPKYDKMKLIVEEGIKISIKNNNLILLGSFYYTLATVYDYGYNDYNQAIDLYNLVIDKYLDEKYWDWKNNEVDYKYYPFLSLGKCYLKTKNYKNALKTYEKALNYSKKDELKMSECFYGMGASYYFLEDDKNALKYAEKALKLEPNNKLAKELLENSKANLRR